MNRKKELGQFNTTKKNYILNGFDEFLDEQGKWIGFVKTTSHWIDPFAGNGDLLTWIKPSVALVQGFDIDPTKQTDIISIRDSLRDVPDYTGKYVITNPPYLARNKSSDKTLYDQHQLNDLYKIAIKTLMGCEGGILIVPLNFLSSPTASDIRGLFFSRYKILKCKVFEERVFEDTDYTVCAFAFEKGMANIIKVKFMPSELISYYHISKEHGWILGEEFHAYIKDVNAKGIGRWTVNSSQKIPLRKLDRSRSVFVNDFQTKKLKYFNPKIFKDIILIRAIDTGTEDGQIKLENIRDTTRDLSGLPILLGLESSRNLAHVRFSKKLSLNDQQRIINRVNDRIQHFRNEYHSMFLTAFRNSTEVGSRKRMGFDDMYKMIKKAMIELGIE